MGRKFLTAAVGVTAALTLLALLIYHSDWYQRHYGMGDSDRMNIQVCRGGQLLPPDGYSLEYSIGTGERKAARTAKGYAIDSDYGRYDLTISVGGRLVESSVYNSSNWWRSLVRFDLLDQPDGSLRVVRTVIILNDGMPIETEEWTVK